MDPEKKSLNFLFPTKYVIPKSLKFSHWPSKIQPLFIIQPNVCLFAHLSPVCHSLAIKCSKEPPSQLWPLCSSFRREKLAIFKGSFAHQDQHQPNYISASFTAKMARAPSLSNTLAPWNLTAKYPKWQRNFNFGVIFSCKSPFLVCLP